MTFGIIILITTLILAAILIYTHWRQAQAAVISWIPLPAEPDLPTLYYWSSHPSFAVDPQRLQHAVRLAIDALAAHTSWGRNRIVTALNGVRIQVNAEESWDARGVKVAGQTGFTGFTVVAVGPTFAALCHELGHVLEVRLDGKEPDYEHAEWAANGMNVAQTEYGARILVP